MAERLCPECGKKVSRTSASGLCRLHFNLRLANDPEVQAKKVATRHFNAATNPAYRAILRMAARKAAKTRWANPEYAEKARKSMREKVQPKSLAPEYRECKVAAARASAEKRIAWCPPEYRDLYRDMIKNKRHTKATAKPIILAKAKADLANLSPFERQERALRMGAKLVANDVKPSLANPGIYEERKAG